MALLSSSKKLPAPLHADHILTQPWWRENVISHVYIIAPSQSMYPSKSPQQR